jgi:hypothetical protein
MPAHAWIMHAPGDVDVETLPQALANLLGGPRPRVEFACAHMNLYRSRLD